jgi:hypothetical protein
VGQAPPLAARPQHVEDGIEDVAPHVVAGPARLWGLWQQQLDELPFVVGEICRIRYAFHPLVYMPFPFFTPVSDSFLRVINLTNAMGGVRPELVGLEEVQRLTRLRFPRIPEELLRILVGNNTLRVAGTIVLFYTLRAQSLVGDRVLEACFWGWPLGGYKSPAGC